MNQEEQKPYGFCRNCGHSFTEDDVFCEGCGGDLSLVKESIKRREQKEQVEEQPVITHTKKKKKNRNLMIGLVVILLIAGLAVGGFFLKQYLDEEKPVEEAWGQTYYVYLKEMKEEGKEEEAGIPKDMKDAKLTFYEVSDLDDPIMVLEYQVDEEVYSNIYYIEEEKVNALTYQKPTEVELLYNIDSKEYDYYIHTSEEDKDSYQSISHQIESISKNQEDSDDSNKVEATPEYVFTKDDVETVTDEDGKELSVSKFDTTFVKVENTKDYSINYKNDLTEKELKDLMNEGVSSYLPQKELISKELEKEVEKKAQDIKEKQEQMEKIKKEIEAKGFKVGDHYLKYGKYQSDQEPGTISGGYYTLNPDGTFVYENTWENMLGERTTTKRTGTYEAKFSTGDMMDPKQCWIIIFHTKESNETYPQETDVYDVLEDNKFTARQYPNTWTPVE